jgi:DNA-binding NtrC family response regulator
MNNKNKVVADKTDLIKIFLVDDDAFFLKALQIEFLENADFLIETYATGELCLANLKNNPDIIILDYHLNGIDLDAMNGIDILDEIKAYNKNIQVVMLSSQDEINVAVNCMHHKAFDYVVKNETAFLRLQNIITNIFKFQKMEKQLNWYMDRI